MLTFCLLKCKRKRGSFPFLTHNAYLSTMRGNKLLYDRQTYPRTASLPRPRLHSPVKPLTIRTLTLKLK